jgi:purine nucleosidase
MPLTDAQILARLEPPQGRVDLVLDTDTFNEIDDQFALVLAALAGERIGLRAVHAVPFDNQRSAGPADGMEKSHEEILRVLGWLGRDPAGLVFRGSTAFLDARRVPERSPSTDNLYRLALSMPEGKPLYVAAIGAITNLANALLLHPDLAERIVVVWLGGHPGYCSNQMEFNLKQDAHAVNVVLDSRVPFIRIPCAHVAEFLRTTEPEVASLFKGKGAIGDYLYKIYVDYMGTAPAVSKVIWDIAVPGWFLDPSHFQSEILEAPRLATEPPHAWLPGPGRHPIRVCTRLHRDPIYRALAARVAAL